MSPTFGVRLAEETKENVDRVRRSLVKRTGILRDRPLDLIPRVSPDSRMSKVEMPVANMDFLVANDKM